MEKEETLEEAAERISKEKAIYESAQDDTYHGFILGAKWQAERMYSRDHLLFFAGYCRGRKETNPNMSISDIFDEWEERFKKDKL